MKEPVAVRRRRSGDQLKCRWAGLRCQVRQQQLQTRLKSTCRRATNGTRVLKLRAADMAPVMPWLSVRALSDRSTHTQQTPCAFPQYTLLVVTRMSASKDK
jgi:hypothetical protein